MVWEGDHIKRFLLRASSVWLRFEGSIPLGKVSEACYLQAQVLMLSAASRRECSSLCPFRFVPKVSSFFMCMSYVQNLPHIGLRRFQTLKAASKSLQRIPPIVTFILHNRGISRVCSLSEGWGGLLSREGITKALLLSSKLCTS